MATVGINPSVLEFRDNNRRELTGRNRRLSTHTSLGHLDLANAPMTAVREILADCSGYFYRRPYLQWFNQLDRILKECGGSFFDGSACSLDLVQWATDPVWGKLPTKCSGSAQGRLLAADEGFLATQLGENPNLTHVLANGKQVVEGLRGMGFPLHSAGLMTTEGRQIELFFADTGERKFIGWSANLQSSHLTTVMKQALAKRVGELYRNGC